MDWGVHHCVLGARVVMLTDRTAYLSALSITLSKPSNILKPLLGVSLWRLMYVLIFAGCNSAVDFIKCSSCSTRAQDL